MWAPDVYQGAPAPVSAFVAVVSKGAMSALLLRYFLTAHAYRFGPVPMMIQIVAFASMLVGNLLAPLQTNIKRILPYSSISHLGYPLVAFLAVGALRVEAVSYYLVPYMVMTLGAFGIITVLSASSAAGEIEELAAYHGLIWRRPWLGGTFAVMLLSLAGIPLTMGFVGKFYAIDAEVSAAMWPAVIALIVGIIGLFCYLRVIGALCTPTPEGLSPYAGAVPRAGGAALALLSLALTWLGVYPTRLLQLIHAIAGTPGDQVSVGARRFAANPCEIHKFGGLMIRLTLSVMPSATPKSVPLPGSRQQSAHGACASCVRRPSQYSPV